MQRIFDFLTSSRTLTILGLIAVGAFLFIAADTLEIDMIWPAIAFGALILFAVALALWRRHRAKQASRKLTGMLEQQAEKAVKAAEPGRRAELEALRKRLGAAASTIKTPKMGQVSGSSALYEPPWYLVIGNPSAG